MEKHDLLVNHTAGISIIAFIVVVGISMEYYQFLYVPQSKEKPVLPSDLLNPPQTTNIRIFPGSTSPSQTREHERVMTDDKKYKNHQGIKIEKLNPTEKERN